MVAQPSTPGWKFGYVPSAGEWANAFAGKVDFPAPIAQGGIGAITAADGNYNLQQRGETNTATLAAKPLTINSLRTDELSITVDLPLLGGLQPGDWIELIDTGYNAAVNPVLVQASGSDLIYHSGTPASSLSLFNNGVSCVLVVTTTGWRAITMAQGTGFGFAAAGVRTITTSVAVDQSYVGFLCKTLGAGITITLPGDGFIAGNTIAFDNTDGTNAVAFNVSSGDAPNAIFAGDCCIVVADGEGGWFKASYWSSNKVAAQPVPAQIADTTYTLQITDTGQYLQFTASSPVTVTIPANADVPFVLGNVTVIEQLGTGTITLVAAGGVTLNGHNGKRSGGQFAVMQIKNGSNGSADTWTVLGDAMT